MVIQIELNPALEARLAAEARARGMALEGYAEQVLQDAMLEALVADRNTRPRASQDEFRAFLDALAGVGAKDAPANVDTFSREAIYSEHD